jgi:hypothetical protein
VSPWSTQDTVQYLYCYLVRAFRWLFYPANLNTDIYSFPVSISPFSLLALSCYSKIKNRENLTRSTCPIDRDVFKRRPLSSATSSRRRHFLFRLICPSSPIQSIKQVSENAGCRLLNSPDIQRRLFYRQIRKQNQGKITRMKRTSHKHLTMSSNDQKSSN